MCDIALIVWLPIYFHRLDIDIFTTYSRGQYCERFSIIQMHLYLGEQRRTNLIFTTYRIDRIKSHSTEYIPGRHLSTILISTQSGRCIEIKVMHDLRRILLSFPRLTYLIIQINHMMARLITMSILANHTCTEKRQICITSRDISKHTIQLFRKTVLTTSQGN